MNRRNTTAAERAVIAREEIMPSPSADTFARACCLALLLLVSLLLIEPIVPGVT